MSNNDKNSWHAGSWQNYPCKQQVNYPDQNEVTRVIDTLSQLPPLVIHTEVHSLREKLADAEKGNCFILQGGDCAEQFADCRTKLIMDKFRIILQMSLVLLQGSHKAIVRVGRIGGQYAKPRSSATETRGEHTLPSYRGDNVNRADFNEKARIPNPKLMLEGYYRSATALNFLRALINGHFADLEHPEYWDLDFVKHSPMKQHFQEIVHSIASSLDFVKAIKGIRSESIDRVDFFTSHEALLLPYEQALTRQAKNGNWYNLSTHFPWIGARTGQIDGAHIEYLRGVKNPIGIKVGPQAGAEWLKAVINKLNPDNESGKIMLITRLGCKQVDDCLPPLIEAINRAGLRVVWSCDPMHGNTQSTQEGVKTRSFDNILMELKKAIQIHRSHNSHLGGVHFELTGDNVTECIGGARGLSEEDLQHAYKSLVDPRLNYEQSLEMAMLLAKEL